MTSVYYKNFVVDKISLQSPIKCENSYKSKILYNGGILLLQTPDIIFETNNEIYFKMNEKGNFFTVLDDIHSKICEILYLKSKDFFKGRQFSENRIKEATKKLMEINNEGNIKLLTNTTENTKYYNRFKDYISKPNESFIGSCILLINSLTFEGRNVNFDITIKAIKVNQLFKKKLVKCLFEDSDNGDSDKEHEKDIEENSENEDTLEIEKNLENSLQDQNFFD